MGNKEKEKEPNLPDINEPENLGTALSIDDKDLVDIHQLIRTNYACDGENHLFNEAKKTVNDFSETEIMMLLLNQMKIPLKKNFTYEQINNQAKRTFGKSYTLEKKNYESCPKYNLNQETGEYIYDENYPCGFTCATSVVERKLSATKYKDRIELETVVAFLTPDGAYYDSKHQELIEALDENNTSEFTIATDKITKYPHYRYTFTLEDGHYYFTSIEKIS